MKFSNKVDDKTSKNAWEIWKSINPYTNITLKEFRKKLKISIRKSMSIDDIIEMSPINLGIHTFEEYNDENVKFLHKIIKTRHSINPVIFIHTKTGRIFLLDGLYRMAAANLKKSNVIAIIIEN